jgi:hypothetical protein
MHLYKKKKIIVAFSEISITLGTHVYPLHTACPTAGMCLSEERKINK